MSHSRKKAAQVAEDTVECLRVGRYINGAGAHVPLRPLIDAAEDGTVTYPPDEPLPPFSPPVLGCSADSEVGGAFTTRETPTVFEVVNDTTLAAARKLVGEGFRPVALNFASARNPGGGFLNGARAQEESLCRASSLYSCIAGNDLYRHHAPLPGGWYTNYAIYSPDVPVFKDDEGNPLDEPYLCAFVTAPAVNAGVYVKDHKPERLDTVRDEMRARVEKVLAIMAGHGHDAAVLGAWGCGVFKNDPETIAELFAQSLRGRFANVFAKVVFAVLTPDDDAIRPFRERFGPVTP